MQLIYKQEYRRVKHFFVYLKKSFDRDQTQPAIPLELRLSIGKTPAAELPSHDNGRIDFRGKFLYDVFNCEAAM